jgi:NADPH:quinone reductase-like Zn-dependent oxidoreductase
VKAIVLRAHGSADHFQERTLEIPGLRPGDVRVRLEAAGFNPVDCQVRAGRSEAKRSGSMILGRDFSGTIDAVGVDVEGFGLGEAVYGNVCTLASSGTYAAYVSVPAELVARKPASLDHLQAAAVPVAGITASLALERARAGTGTSLFIAGGAGGVGSFAIALARQLGVQDIVATAGSPKSRAHLVRCGLRDDRIVDYRDAAFAARAMQVNGGPFDIALDLVGGAMLSACCTVVAVDGHVASATEAPSREDFDVLFDRNATFHPVGANAYALDADRASWRRYGGILARLARGFDSGVLAAPRVTNLGPMSEAVVKRAHQMLEGNAVQGKLVMTVGPLA